MLISFTLIVDDFPLASSSRLTLLSVCCMGRAAGSGPSLIIFLGSQSRARAQHNNTRTLSAPVIIVVISSLLSHGEQLSILKLQNPDVPKGKLHSYDQN